MKTKGKSFKGLQRKALALMLIMMIAIILLFAGISAYQNRMLVGIVGQTRVAQQQSISQVSAETMHQMLESSLVSTASLQANIADKDFAEVADNIRVLQALAQDLFARRDSLVPETVALPDPSMEGQTSAMVLCEEGVDYSHSEYLGIAAHMRDAMIAVHRSSEKIDSCYIGLVDGTDLCVDEKPLSKLDAAGVPLPFPVRERPWYVAAVKEGDLHFSGILQDAFTGRYVITCSAPVLVDGELFGVVGLDIVLESMTDYVSSSDAAKGAYSYVVNEAGQVVLAPDGEGVFAFDSAGGAADLRSLGNPELTRFVDKALAESTELTILTINGKEYYLAGAPVPSVGWAMILVVDKASTEQPARQMLAEYDRLNADASARFENGSGHINKTILMLIALILLIGGSTAVIATGRIVRPLEEMTNNISDSSQTGELFRMQDVYRTHDEIEILAEAFADLSQKTKQYIQNITEITREKERIGTELELASKIQSDMLPNIFPPFPERQDLNIFAGMDPAKEVGGDFYDFFLLDEEHLGLVVADVSGKGIPAALFMMISKILVQNYALTGRSPREVLEVINDQICQNNREEMFVTVWLGILDLKTGHLTAANAGHEYPVLMQPGGRFEIIKDKHGFVIGGMAGIKYTEYELQLEKGARLFLYTDGVPEATNAQNELFGMDRLLAALNECNTDSPQQIVERVRSSMDVFVGDAPQFDDITMLCVEYLGTDNLVKERVFDARIDNIPAVTDFINAELEAMDCPMKVQMQIDVAIDEIFSNIANYAYTLVQGDGKAVVRFERESDPRAAVITFIDSGIPYNPLEAPEPDVTLPVEQRQAGGLGIFMVRKTMNQVSYEFVGGRNILRIRKLF